MDCSMDARKVQQNKRTGGESGIRTHVRVSPKHAFQACAFSHSAISPALLPQNECVTRWARRKLLRSAEAQNGSVSRFYGEATAVATRNQHSAVSIKGSRPDL